MSLWNSTQKIRKIGSPQSCTHHKRPLNQETSFCIYQKASYTVEAVVVLPFMAAFFASILFFFRILQVQVTVEEALLYAGRKTSVEASMLDSEELLLLSAKGFLMYALEDRYVIEKYVRGGSGGVLLLGSYCNEEEIILHASYEVVMPVAFWDIGRIPLYSQNSFQKWNGDKSNELEKDWVYITPSGTVYHTSLDCRILDVSIREVPIAQIGAERGKNGQKYYLCKRCKKDKTDKVYCTDYGTLYHTDIACSYLTRNIQKIEKEEIGERPWCSFCEKEN